MNRIAFFISIIFTGAVIFTSCLLVEYRSKTNELHILTWGDYFSDEALEDFEQKNNTSVHLHYYSTNEEMMKKLKYSKPGDFDLVVPSDYAVKILSDRGLLEPLDKSKLPLKKISPQLLSRSFDPYNKYSIPYTWEFYGLASIRKPYSSYTDLFTENNVVMTPDPMEATSIAAELLFNRQNAFSSEELRTITALLKKQYPNTLAYADYRAPFLLKSKDASLALMRSSLAWGMIDENPNIFFNHPDKKIFITIENFCIPKGSKKQEITYTFIKHCFIPSNQAIHVSLCPMYPSNPKTLKFLNLPQQAHRDYKKVLNASSPRFFSHISSEKNVQRISHTSKNQ